MVSTDDIKTLRAETGLSLAQIKEALESSNGDMEKARVALVAKSSQIAEKKASRALGAGVVSAYIHSNKSMGAIVELNCETDFVAKNEEFIALAHDIAMQVGAMNPENVEALLQMEFIKDPSKKIKDLVDGAVQKFGERTEVRRFERFTVLN